MVSCAVHLLNQHQSLKSSNSAVQQANAWALMFQSHRE